VGLAWERACTSNDKYMCGETALGHVMMWDLIIVLTGVVFHAPHDRRLSVHPLAAPAAPVTL
jgi:hypothetical protein